MKKSFVLDTNVLIHDPEAILQFVDNDVILPITVIEELDKLKRGNGDAVSDEMKSVRYLKSGDKVFVGTPNEHGDDKETDYRSADFLIESGIVHIEPLTYIRGRSLPKRFLIIDEAQNLRPLDVKTIITRCGEGTKVVFTGDLEQIDSPFLDAASNGLAHLINKFIQEENFCYLNLKQSARSVLAERAAELL